jgi:hypothetical protein
VLAHELETLAGFDASERTTTSATPHAAADFGFEKTPWWTFSRCLGADLLELPFQRIAHITVFTLTGEKT